MWNPTGIWCQWQFSSWNLIIWLLILPDFFLSLWSFLVSFIASFFYGSLHFVFLYHIYITCQYIVSNVIANIYIFSWDLGLLKQNYNSISQYLTHRSLLVLNGWTQVSKNYDTVIKSTAWKCKAGFKLQLMTFIQNSLTLQSLMLPHC